jgi:hypothetical protein
MRCVKWTAAVLLAGLVLGGIADAQTSSGTLSGRVTYEGEGLPGVTVMVTSETIFPETFLRLVYELGSGETPPDQEPETGSSQIPRDQEVCMKAVFVNNHAQACRHVLRSQA